jgi:hypothetical protein
MSEFETLVKSRRSAMKFIPDVGSLNEGMLNLGIISKQEYDMTGEFVSYNSFQ